jgi:hypothetical protein
MVKTGCGADLPQPDPNDDTSPMFWGTLFESFVAAHYTKRTGITWRQTRHRLPMVLILPPPH